MYIWAKFRGPVVSWTMEIHSTPAKIRAFLLFFNFATKAATTVTIAPIDLSRRVSESEKVLDVEFSDSD